MLNLKQRREQIGLTQPELAALMKVHDTTVSKWETGAALPRAEKLIKLSAIFHCTIDDLLKNNLPK